MVRKVVNNTRRKQNEPMRLRSFQEERDERLGLRILGVDSRYLQDLGDELIEWAKDRSQKNRVSLEHFYEEKDICDRTFREWCEKEPYLAECRRRAKIIMGNRLEEGLLHKTMSERGVLLQMHHYKERWDKINKYHSSLKVEEGKVRLEGLEFVVPELKREVKNEDGVQQLPGKKAESK
jgi:hypothetical protein